MSVLNGCEIPAAVERFVAATGGVAPIVELGLMPNVNVPCMKRVEERAEQP